MGVYLGKELIGVIIDPDITEENINSYKAHDVSEVIVKGGNIASDYEYIQAEKSLQELYHEIMMGGEING